MRELSVQAANDTNNDSDRASLQAEVAQLKSELDRIAETTNFNGNKILSGDYLARDLQVGANVGETLSVSIDGAATTDLARQVRTEATTVTDATFGGAMTITYNGDKTASVRATNAGDDRLSTSMNSSSAIAKAAAVNSLADTTGVRAIVGETELTGAAVTSGTLDTANYITINDEKISGFAVQANDADGSLVDAINAVADETGVVASLNSDSQLVLTAADGRNIEVSTSSVTVANITGLNAAAAGDTVTYGEISLQSDNTFELAGADTATLGMVNGVYGVNSDSAVSSVDISTREGAVKALDTIDLALEDVSASRAKLGAL
jgi:flagellin